LAEIRLAGCAPEPLMSYLKALGVFRVVAEQKDAVATLSWRGDVACLDTNLDHDGLVAFLLDA
jgi:CRISPR-associated protein Csx17